MFFDIVEVTRLPSDAPSPSVKPASFSGPSLENHIMQYV